MPDPSQDVLKRKPCPNKEAGFQQRLWKLWFVIFAAGLAAAVTASLAPGSMCMI